jgi:hypothetical protein
MSGDASYGSDVARCSDGPVDVVTRSRGRRTAPVVVCTSMSFTARAPRRGCAVRQCRDETRMRVGESFTASSSPECRKPASEAGRRHRATCAGSIATSLCGSLQECGTNPSRSSRPRGDLSRGIDCSGLQLLVTKPRPLPSVRRSTASLSSPGWLLGCWGPCPRRDATGPTSAFSEPLNVSPGPPEGVSCFYYER